MARLFTKVLLVRSFTDQLQDRVEQMVQFCILSVYRGRRQRVFLFLLLARIVWTFSNRAGEAQEDCTIMQKRSEGTEPVESRVYRLVALWSQPLMYSLTNFVAFSVQTRF